MGEPERAAVTPKAPLESLGAWREPGRAAARGMRDRSAETFIVNERVVNSLVKTDLLIWNGEQKLQRLVRMRTSIKCTSTGRI
jgi:hypothetical protein